MNKHSSLNPFDVPKVFRNYVYDHVVLAWESDRVSIAPSVFSKKLLHASLGLRVEKVGKLSEIERRSRSSWGSDEFLIFYAKGKGYELLFKRLRASFAHGDYGLGERGFIKIWHRYKGPGEKMECTRLFARLRQSRFKELIAFLDQSNSLRVGGDI